MSGVAPALLLAEGSERMIGLLGPTTLRTSALLLLCFAAGVALRSTSPRLRYAVWSTGLLAVLALPLLSTWTPRWEVPFTESVRLTVASAGGAWDRAAAAAPRVDDPGKADRPALVLGDAGAEPQEPRSWRGTTDATPTWEEGAPSGRNDEDRANGAGGGGDSPGRPTDPLGPAGTADQAPVQPPESAGVARALLGPLLAWPGWRGLLSGLWLAGFVALVARLTLGVARVRTLAGRAHPPDARCTEAWSEVRRDVDLSSSVRLLVSSEVTNPMTFGHRRPTVLLPEAARAWPRERLHAVLLHEATHVKRRHWPIQMAAYLSRALHWFNPLSWWAVDRLTYERERSCDEDVIAAGIARADYAAHLVEIARERRSAGQPVAALALTHPQRFEERVMSILNPTGSRPLGAGSIAAACLLVGASALVVAGAAFGEPGPRATPEEQERPPVPPTPAAEPAAPVAAVPILADTPVVVALPTPPTLPTPLAPLRPAGAVPVPPVVIEPLDPVAWTPFRPSPPTGVVETRVLETPAPLVTLPPPAPVPTVPVPTPTSPLQCPAVIDAPSRLSAGLLDRGVAHADGDLFLRHEFDDGSCLEALVIGEVSLNEPGDAVLALGSGASVQLAGILDGSVHHVTITPGPDGSPSYAWTIDGAEREPDPAWAREWVALALELVADAQNWYEAEGAIRRGRTDRTEDVLDERMREELARLQLVQEEMARTAERRARALEESALLRREAAEQLEVRFEEMRREMRRLEEALVRERRSIADTARSPTEEWQRMREALRSIEQRADSLRLGRLGGIDTLSLARERLLDSLRLQTELMAASEQIREMARRADVALRDVDEAAARADEVAAQLEQRIRQSQEEIRALRDDDARVLREQVEAQQRATRRMNQRMLELRERLEADAAGRLRVTARLEALAAEMRAKLERLKEVSRRIR